MPNMVYTGENTLNFGDLTMSKEYGYKYPNDLKLKPGSELHEKIKNQILENARASQNVMQRRFTGWRKTDDKMTGFMEPEDYKRYEQQISGNSSTYPETTSSYSSMEGNYDNRKKRDSNKPHNIVFPYSYVIMETLVSYLCSAFLPNPIFRYEGVAPDDTIGAIMLEQVIDLHCQRNKVALNFHTQFRDSTCYGLGIVSPYWEERYGLVTRKKQSGMLDFLGKFVKTGEEKEVKEELVFEGNALNNVDPYYYLPDPNVALQNIQKGEFVGWVDKNLNIYTLLEQEQHDENMFNVKYLKHVKNKSSSIYGDDNASRRMHKVGGNGKDNTTLNPVDVIWMYQTLIPRDWHLGKSELPEKWLFGLAADSVIIKAGPIGLAHNMYPIAVAAPDFDGYSPTAFSRIEIEHGLQVIIDWLLNSHISNVRKAINDMLIVDPYLVNINDLKTPEPGKLIRLRRPAWGRGVEKVVQQLAVNDITRNNIGDAQFIMGMMDVVAGTNNPMQGSLRQSGPDRLTGKEFSGTMSGAMARMERVAKMIGLQSMQDIGYMFASNAQQLMSQDTYVKCTGSWQEVLASQYGTNISNTSQKSKMKVTPFDLLINYDVLVKDGSIPGGNYNESWVQLYQILGSNPQLASRFDMVRIFKFMARNMGAKNVDDFELSQMTNIPPVQGQGMPDQQIDQQVQAGNLVPVGGVNG